MAQEGPLEDALKRWEEEVRRPSLEARPETDHPFVFVSFSRSAFGAPLTGRGVAVVLRRLCEESGMRVVAPHALRHASITHALDATGGDIRRVRAFSRHAKLETVAIYDDARRDSAGQVAALIAL